MVSTALAHLTCLCGAVSAPGTLLHEAEIPISAGICHCSSCRHTTGSLGVSFPLLKSAPAEDTISQTTVHRSSHGKTWYFCSKCGCHCFLLNHHSGKWYCLGGIIEPSVSAKEDSIIWPEDIIKVSHHEHVLDTLDGGLVPILLDLNRHSVPTWSAAPQYLPEQNSFDLSHDTVLSLPTSSVRDLMEPKDGSYLPAKCHCGGVTLLIKRADYTSNTELPARFIPTDPTKYLTYLCACRSCRLSTGVSLTPWALIPPGNVFNANAPTNASDAFAKNILPVIFGKFAGSLNANPGLTLSHNWSSPDTCRSFCGQCGATVFYWCSQRPDELDLAVGILRADEGSMARRWLEWEWGRCSFADECIDREVCEAWLGSAEAMERISG